MEPNYIVGWNKAGVGQCQISQFSHYCYYLVFGEFALHLLLFCV